ncbi:MAG: glutathione S-transferase [Rhizobacter sp.]|nr:glutathione S-transferase [Bacteriovorax sp.]
MITLHHLNNSRSQRILWLLEELGIKYEIKYYQRNKETMLAPPELKMIHPLGKSPVITDGDVTIAESAVIIEYLIEKYGNGKLKPAPGTPALMKYNYWMHFAEGTAMSPLLLALIFNRIDSSPVPFFIKPIIKKITGKVRTSFINPNLKNNFDFIEGELAKAEWFAGNEFTGADIQMSFPMEAGTIRAGDFGPYSKKYLEKIHSRPAYKKALEIGGEYTIGK